MNDKIDENINLFKKYLELEPFSNIGHVNLAYLMLKKDRQLLSKINYSSTLSVKEREIQEEAISKRKEYHSNEIIPLMINLEKIEPNNFTAIHILKDSYKVIGDNEKYLKYEALENDLK